MPLLKELYSNVPMAVAINIRLLRSQNCLRSLKSNSANLLQFRFEAPSRDLA